jgi:hypothetical protein
MSELTINRRQAVRAAAGVAAGGLLVAGAGVGAASADGGSLLGSWLIHYEDLEGNQGLAVATLADNGIFLTNEVRPAGAVGTGSWKAKGDDRFKTTSWSANAADNTSSMLEVWGKHKDDKVSGKFMATSYDGDGNETGTLEGTFWGEPLEA